jgi:hypothetical protein
MVLKMILMIALEFQLEPGFVQAIALTENPQLNPHAIHVNNNGTLDRGLMQLNSSWYVSDTWYELDDNIRAACEHIKWLRLSGLNWWQIAIAYNCGYYAVVNRRIPAVSLDYASNVMRIWQTLEPRNYAARGGN